MQYCSSSYKLKHKEHVMTLMQGYL